jgi:hypothetical protein
MLRIVWLLGSQDPIPGTAADTGRHLMRMESEDKGGSEAEETSVAFTTPEMGIIFPETEDKKDKEEEESVDRNLNHHTVGGFSLRSDKMRITEIQSMRKDRPWGCVRYCVLPLVVSCC